MITEEEAEGALAFLIGSDEEEARLNANMERMEEKAKQMKSAQFLCADGKTIPEKEANAANSPAYNNAREEYYEAVSVWRAVNNERTTRRIQIEMYRTQAANRRQGNI